MWAYSSLHVSWSIWCERNNIKWRVWRFFCTDQACSSLVVIAMVFGFNVCINDFNVKLIYRLDFWEVFNMLYSLWLWRLGWMGKSFGLTKIARNFMSIKLFQIGKRCLDIVSKFIFQVCLINLDHPCLIRVYFLRIWFFGSSCEDTNADLGCGVFYGYV